MGKSKITVSLRGWVGRDPEMRYTPNGDAVTTFSVAVSRGQGRDSDWYRVTAWGKLAEFSSEYVKARAFIALDGRLERREWAGQDGRHHDVEVVASSVDLLERPSDAAARAVPAAGVSRAPDPDLVAAAEPIGDIPF